LPRATSLTISQTASSATWAIDVADGTATTAPLTDLTITAAGSLTLTGEDTTALGNVERLSITADKTFTHNTNYAKATSVVLAGAKDDSAIDLANLGGNNAYGLTVTATGLKAALDIDTLQVGTGQTISLNISGKTGTAATTIGDNTNGGLFVGTAVGTIPTVLGGSVTLNAADATSTGNLIVEGAIFAKNVTLDASGSSFGSTATTGVLTFAQKSDGSATTKITGETVVVKASAAPTAFYLGNIDVKDSLTYVGPSVVAANALTITAHTGSTALNVDLTGGVAVDTFTLNGIATNTSITVKGDLKASTDTLTIDASASTVSGGQTIDVSGLVSTNVTITGSTTVKDTIKGSPVTTSLQPEAAPTKSIYLRVEQTPLS